MGFSFRSLYTDDDHPSQGGSTGLLRRGAPDALSRPSRQLPIQDLPLAATKSAPSGIPGPLTDQTLFEGPAASPSAINKPAIPTPSDEPLFYSLDSLEPEPHMAEQSIAPQQDETESPTAESISILDDASRLTPSDESWRDAQTQLRAVFSVTGSFTLETIAALTAKLPGVSSCLIQTSQQALLANANTEQVQNIEITADAAQTGAFQASFSLLGLDQVEGILLRSASGSATCFSSSGLSLMARHADENLEPGLWEKLLLITQASAKLKPTI